MKVSLSVDFYDKIKNFRYYSRSTTVMDAWGKIPSNLLGGNFQWLGNIDECDRIKAVVNNTEMFTGKYCRISLDIGNVPAALKVRSIHNSVKNLKLLRFYMAAGRIVCITTDSGIYSFTPIIAILWLTNSYSKLLANVILH